MTMRMPTSTAILMTRRPPLLDEAYAGQVADTGEEKHHAPVLHHRVLGISPDALGVENAVQDRENCTADDRRRNAVFPKQLDFRLQKAAKKKDSHRRRQSLVHIQIDFHNKSPIVIFSGNKQTDCNVHNSKYK